MNIENISPVSNPELKEAIKAAKSEPGMETTVALLNKVVEARLLAPVSMDRDPEYDAKIDEVVLEKDTQISFELIKSSNGELYYPVFTDGPEMKKCEIDKDQHSLIINFDDLAAMLLQPQNAVAGFVINPMSDNICFSTEMVAAMKKDMEKEKQENGK
ncbi:MAG: SseB family protein [Bacillota bacterium]|nr:SseB family protein [Bacillota bacterium]